MRIPGLLPASAASIVASVLTKEVLQDVSSSSNRKPWIMIDFCAGGGGPTPSIERAVNADSSSSSSKKKKPTQFVLTDLHPHVADWTLAAAASPNVRFAAQPVDASAADTARILQGAYGVDSESLRVMRLFNLSFHHFDDPLAKAILKDAVESSDGFGIFELQDRSLSSFVTTLFFGLSIMVSAPYYAFKWRSFMTLVFTYLIPVLPFVLVFDGWVSMLRTRTPEELEALLRTCGADTVAADGSSTWELRHGTTQYLRPTGYLNWFIATKKQV